MFKVFARQKDLAKEILEKYQVKNYSIDYVCQERLKEEFRTAKFGFCIRDDIEVNRVATPTKLSNYIANGIIPIYSRCIDSFAKQSDGFKFGLCVDDNDFIDKIVRLCTSEISIVQVTEEILRCYGDYYSSIYYIKRLVNLLGR